MGRLDGKVTLVTGAARGTGAVIARLFVEEGAERVIVADVRDDLGEAHAEALGPTARYLHLDVTSEADWERVVDDITADEGRLDVLVNNAAVLLLATIDRTEAAEFERIMRVNAFGAFLGIRTCLPLLRANGNGSIVNLGSIDSVYGTALTAAYTASKFAMRGLTKVTAIENGKFGVRCNIVCPEAGNPEMHTPIVGAEDWPPLPPDPSRGPDTVAPAAVFFASDESRLCNGTELVMDRGHYAGEAIDLPDFLYERP
ncbi:MAG: SDR family oxidoreductase [Actinobacteria bacterium]|nr:SDR family oxidoreductase [Actinomycetota bacterium]